MPVPRPTFTDDADPPEARPELPNEPPDRTILKWAERQHGVVARRQLLGDGVPPHVIDYRLRCGRLKPIHRGVYRSGPVVAPDSREMAALLACGDGSALSHGTAATIWELVSPRRSPSLVDVTCSWSLRGHRGVRLHRVRLMDPDEVAIKRGLRVTNPARTLVDLATTTKLAELEQAIARAARRGLATRRQMEKLLKGHPHRRGNRMLTAALELSGGPSLTRSEAEARFLSLVRRAGLPRPSTNVMVEGFELDFFWRSQRLVVEIDGFAYHGGRDAFERDRERDAKLTAAGLRVVRLTWRQLNERHEAVLVQLSRALAVKVPKT